MNDAVFEILDHATVKWTMRAARGECAWVCPDCSSTFPGGMPDECAHGHQRCTDIIQIDKASSRNEVTPNAALTGGEAVRVEGTVRGSE